ncbi:MAG TPA: WD40 repeat domain-containing protein [Ktedonobacteraceae bacterium]|nr:WD40 repeat domain-containing protein [Ktedonobacteraceae bacterium]
MQLYLHPTRPEALTLNDQTTMLTRWSLVTHLAKQLIQHSTLPGEPLILPIGQKIIQGGITGALDGGLFAHAHCSSANTSRTDLLDLRYWQDLSLAQTLTIPGVEAITSLASSPDGRWLVMGAAIPERLFLFDRLSGEVMSDHFVGGYLTTGLTFDPTSTFVAGITTYDSEGRFMLWRIEPVERFVPRSEGEHISHDSLSPDRISGNTALAVVHWDLHNVDGFPVNFGETVGTTAFSSDSRVVVFSFTYDGVTSPLVAYEVPSGERLWLVDRQGNSLEHFVITPDGRALIFSNGSCDLFVYSMDDGRLMQQLPSGLDEPIKAMAFDHDGKTLWLATRNTLVQYQPSFGVSFG